MTDTEIIEVLRGTKERLFTHGWMKFSRGTKTGPNCLMGAIYEVTDTNAYMSHEIQPVEQAIREVANMGAVDFNDHRAKSFDDIVDVLDRAIKNLEGCNNDH